MVAEHKPGVRESEQALVIGASGAIAAAIVERWATDERFDRIWAVSRTPQEDAPQGSPVRNLLCAYGDGDIAAVVAKVTVESPRLTRIVVTLGTLHGEHHAPEKSLGSLRQEALAGVYHVNCVLPMLWLAALARPLRSNPDCRIAVLSARVGSIGDNRLGGWYSYRCAKAGLNMGLKTAAIELARSAAGVKLLAFHPGTVDTPLSKPFQRGVAAGKLFTPDFVAERLEAVLNAHAPDGELSYLDWAGEPIPW